MLALGDDLLASKVRALAGSEKGDSGDGGPARLARFREITSVAVDEDGNIYLADPVANRIRRIDPSGTITTIAGNGKPVLE